MFSFVPNPTNAKNAWFSSTCLLYACCSLTKILFRFLRQMIEDDNQFLEVTALGSKLAWRVMKLWMTSAGRTLNNYQVILSTFFPLAICFIRCTQVTLSIPMYIRRFNELFKKKIGIVFIVLHRPPFSVSLPLLILQL
jgi:hypothetical protein